MMIGRETHSSTEHVESCRKCSQLPPQGAKLRPLPGHTNCQATNRHVHSLQKQPPTCRLCSITRSRKSVGAVEQGRWEEWEG